MGTTKDSERRKRRVFTDKLKQVVVRLVTTGGYSLAAAAKSLGFGEQRLRQWYDKFAPSHSPCGEDVSVVSNRPSGRHHGDGRESGPAQ